MKIVKQLFLLFIILVIVFPSVQNVYPLIPDKPLHGAFVPAAKPVFSKQTLLSGIYQAEFNKYIEENIGLRSYLVRLKNQLTFSIFNFVTPKGVVIGKNQYLFEPAYILEYTGKSFMGNEYWADKAKKIKAVQVALKTKGVDFLVVIAPSKASFFPEFIPDRFQPAGKYITNTNTAPGYLKAQGVNFINFDDYFLLMKDTSRYPLYPKCGIHWSDYGAVIAMDSIVHYIEKLKSRKMIEINIDGFEITDELRSKDYDIGDVLNLFFTISHYKMAYPKLSYHSCPDVFKPKIITIGDSYYFNIFCQGCNTNVYLSDKFWFYNKQELTTEKPGWVDINKANLKNEILSQDAIVVFCTSANLSGIGFGFIEDAYKVFCEHP
jgi:hypothetical protein